MINNSMFREFKNNEEIIDWVKKYYPDVVDTDKNNEWYYPLLGYTGSMYGEINSKLRYCKGDYKILNTDNYKDIYNDIIQILNFLKGHCLPENVVLYRYTNIQDVKNMNNNKRPKKDDILNSFCFCSTSLLKEGIEHLKVEHENSCLLKIYAPKGVIGSYVSLAENADGYNEHEFLLPPGVQFKILNIDSMLFPKNIECILL